MSSDMWAPADPHHKPKYHTFSEDLRDLGGLIAKCVAWVLGTVLALAILGIAVVLAAWALVQIVDMLRPVPIWAWLMSIPLFGIWRHLSTKER